MPLGELLRTSRQDKGLTQNDVADHLNVSRQAISKWENGNGYPDIDNLKVLSELYEVPITKLLGESKELKEKIEESNESIDNNKSKLKKIHKEEKDEGLLLLILAAISGAVFPLGIILAPAIIIRNKKGNTFYRLIIITCIVCFIVNIYFLWIFIGDRLGWGEQTEVIYTPE